MISPGILMHLFRVLADMSGKALKIMVERRKRTKVAKVCGPLLLPTVLFSAVGFFSVLSMSDYCFMPLMQFQICRLAGL
jgi:hypothetical protein